METTNGADAPEDLIDVPCVVLRITHQYEPYLAPEQLYERTRGYWVLDPSAHPKAEYAFALAGDTIREVYRIHAWEALDAASIPPNPLRREDPDHAEGRAKIRYQFTGELAPIAMRDRYIGMRFVARARNPVLWIHA